MLLRDTQLDTVIVSAPATSSSSVDRYDIPSPSPRPGAASTNTIWIRPTSRVGTPATATPTPASVTWAPAAPRWISVSSRSPYLTNAGPAPLTQRLPGEANSISSAYTPHPCEDSGFHVCNSEECGGTYSPDRYAGDCDPDGCDFNTWRQGQKKFYGPGSGFTVDTTKKVTVVTQFLTSGGQLSEIKRFYVQNGKVIANADDLLGPGGNSITQQWCEDIREVFTDRDVFTEKGGLAQMGRGLTNMVLVLSVWNDVSSPPSPSSSHRTPFMLTIL
jgi:hypothetical protein